METSKQTAEQTFQNMQNQHTNFIQGYMNTLIGIEDIERRLISKEPLLKKEVKILKNRLKRFKLELKDFNMSMPVFYLDFAKAQRQFNQEQLVKEKKKQAAIKKPNQGKQKPVRKPIQKTGDEDEGQKAS